MLSKHYWATRPNDWESQRDLNPYDAADRNGDWDNDGYTNLEDYLNHLVYIANDPVTGDFDEDYDVDNIDLAILAEHWLEDNCAVVPLGNLDSNCDVDFKDFAIFAYSYSR